MNIKDHLEGNKYGRLTVIERDKNKGGSYWLCKCDCGNTTSVLGIDLKDGKTKSCGCLMREVSKDNATKHGFSKTKLYKVWKGIKSRCHNKTNNSYKYYGGKGIGVCKQWEHDFMAFRTWSLDNGYKEGLSIDRIDSNKDYEPSNCRWVTPLIQSNNTSRNHILTYHGESKTMAEWAAEVGIKYSTLRSRVNSYKWPIEKALFSPLRNQEEATIRVKYRDKLCKLEQNGSWIDMRASQNYSYKKGDFIMIDLGVCIELPAGYEAHLLPRSSTFKRYGIIMTNSLGVIDGNYSGNNDWWAMPCLAMRDGEIHKGDRIAQFRIAKEQPIVYVESVNHLDGENRGGFGSTGK